MRQLRLVLLGLAAVLALLLASGFLLRAIQGPRKATVADVPTIQPETPTPSPAPPAKEPTAGPASVQPAPTPGRQTIEQAIATAPDYARFFDRLHKVFPSDYDAILDDLATTSGQTKDVTPDAIMASAIATLRRTRGGLASKASDDILGQIFALQLKEMRELETRDVHLCVSFLYGANGSSFLPFAADHRALVADAAIAGLDAMNSGRTDNVQRAPPSDDDFKLLDKALSDKGLTRPQIDALLDGKTADPPIPDDQMCKAGQTYLETLATMPPDVRARLYGLAVGLMAKS